MAAWIYRMIIFQSGFISALPYLTSWILSIFFSSACDFLVDRGYLRITTARKIFNSIGKSLKVFLYVSTVLSTLFSPCVSFLRSVSIRHTLKLFNQQDLVRSFPDNDFRVNGCSVRRRARRIRRFGAKFFRCYL